MRGKTVVITGGTSGVGEVAAEKLAQMGARIVLVARDKTPMLQRNLLYTGITRGKKLVVLVGQKQAVAIAVRNISGRRRWSKLGEWLRSGAMVTSLQNESYRRQMRFRPPQ
jgi:NADP-dependent 3-hydroxy acid dehydrogenase YdfG